MPGPSDPGFETLSLHAGAAPDPATGARAVPLYLTTSFVFESSDHAAALFNMERSGHVYSRISNPTVAAFEERMASLEGGLGAVATSSGQSAQFLTFAALAVALVARTARLRRPALVITLAAVLYVSLVDPISAFTLNRLYIFTLLVLIVAPAGPTIAAWPMRMLQWTLLTHYFASGLCKSIHGDWLKHQDVLWMQIQGLYMTDTAAWLVRTLPTWAFPLQQHLALGFELLAPVLLGVRRLRPLGFVLGIGLHLVVAVTMYQLIYFSLQMIAFYTLFIDTQALARWRRLLPGAEPTHAPVTP